MPGSGLMGFLTVVPSDSSVIHPSAVFVNWWPGRFGVLCEMDFTDFISEMYF
jgi:hypothetical protein